MPSSYLWGLKSKLSVSRYTIPPLGHPRGLGLKKEKENTFY